MVSHDHFQSPPAWNSLDLGVPDWHVWHVEQTGSTNTDLLDAATAGAPDRTVLATAHQTAGRGRLDRRWDAPPGSNLLVSFLFQMAGDQAHPLTRRIGVAAAAAARTVAGVDARLKWPNDLLLDGRKLAGILAQRSSTGDAVVVGIGLNVGWAPDGAARLGDEHLPQQVLKAVLAAFDAAGPDVDEQYRRLLDTLGRHVRVELAGGDDLVGRAVDVDPEGHLLVIDECAITHRVDAGDVVHLRPANDL